MRILLLAHAPSIHTQRWARAFAARGHDIRLLTLDVAPNAPFPGEAVGWGGIAVPLLRYASARRAVRRAHASWRPDVTVAHFLPNYGFLAALAGARPFALVAWGSDLLVNARSTPAHEARARWVLRRAALVHVDGENLAEAARSLGAPPKRIWTRPWGVDAGPLAPDAPWSERRRRSGTLRILWTRMLEPVYEPSVFLRSLDVLRRRGVEFEATVAGEGSLRPALEAEARALDVAGSVRFVGLVEEGRLRGLYRGHEFYVSMSRSDSTSQSLLEAMAAGLYCIASDIPGNRPWIGGRVEASPFLAERGMLVPPGDSEALADALAEAAGESGGDARVARGTELVRAEASWSDTVAAAEARLLALSEGTGR